MWWLILFLAIADGKPAKVEITGPYTEGECWKAYLDLPAIAEREAVCFRDWKPWASVEGAWGLRDALKQDAPKEGGPWGESPGGSR